MTKKEYTAKLGQFTSEMQRISWIALEVEVSREAFIREMTSAYDECASAQNTALNLIAVVQAQAAVMIDKILLDKSPLHAWQAHRLLGGVEKAPTPAQLKGAAVDALVFGGTVPKLSKTAMEDAEALAAAVKDKLQQRGITGKPQHRLQWTSEGGVECSGVVDLWCPDIAAVYELKTSHDLSEYNIVKQIEQYRYDLQVAAYVEGSYPINVTPYFIFAETAPPYDVRFVSVTPDMLARGRAAWLNAVAQWKHCLAENRWPGRGDFTADVSGWRKKQDADQWLADAGIE
jgi:hypothetical protein